MCIITHRGEPRFALRSTEWWLANWTHTWTSCHEFKLLEILGVHIRESSRKSSKHRRRTSQVEVVSLVKKVYCPCSCPCWEPQGSIVKSLADGKTALTNTARNALRDFHPLLTAPPTDDVRHFLENLDRILDFFNRCFWIEISHLSTQTCHDDLLHDMTNTVHQIF